MNIKKFLLLIAGLMLIAAGVAAEPVTVRFATFNIAMGMEKEGELMERLRSGTDERLIQVSEILQRVRPDVVLLNEFDFQPGSARQLQVNYLQVPRNHQIPVYYRHVYSAPVNTGMDSGLDINNNDNKGDPEDAWGFGQFPGQYGMLVLSRYPINADGIRTFGDFRWSEMPDALQPLTAKGESWYPETVWKQLKLSSKSHWDVPLEINGSTVHFLVSHPTPTVFDGKEDRNGRRNHDENRIWADYVTPGRAGYLVDDRNNRGGIAGGSAFVIAGDLNADPVDGGWKTDSMRQLLEHPQIDASCTPRSRGGAEASAIQGGINRRQTGDPAADTSDFNDEYAGNLRIDYVLPSKNLAVTGCGVFWPASDEGGRGLEQASDHRLVWLDVKL